MKLHALDIPEDSAELVAWLERHIVGFDLRALVAELSVVAGVESKNPQVLHDVLGDRTDNVLSDGLAAAEPGSIQALLRTPHLLFELQERVLVDCGPYWNQLIANATSNVDLQENWQQLRTTIEGSLTRLGPDGQSGPWRDGPVPGGPRVGIPRGLLVVIAASLLIGVATFLFRPPGQQVASGWGFNHPDALQDDLSASDYLRQLASSAGQWQNKRPETREGVRERISQFIAGCDTLIAASHAPLAPADRDWLVERCKAWRDTLAAHVAKLDGGAAPLEVRSASDESIESLAKALHSRADGIAA